MNIHDWFGAITGPQGQLLLASAVAGIGIVQLVRGYRARSIRRRAAARLDEYAEREIARESLRKSFAALKRRDYRNSPAAVDDREQRV
jgi:hypothetical protein